MVEWAAEIDKMKLPAQYLALWFGERLQWLGHRYATGIWDPQDVTQEVLLRLCQRDWPRRPTPSTYHRGEICRTDPARVNLAALREAQMIARTERRRLKAGDVDPQTPAVALSAQSRAALVEALERLTDRQRLLIMSRLEMRRNVRSITVSPSTLRRTAKAAGVSLATASRDLAAARQVLSTALLET